MNDQRLTTTNTTDQEEPTGDRTELPSAPRPHEIGRPATRAEVEDVLDRTWEIGRPGLEYLAER